MEENDVQLQLKKRARRRLVGALAFVSVVAVVLPMVMDHEPRQVVQDVEIRIPGQDEKPFAPKFSAAPVEKSVNKPSDSIPAKPPTEVAESRVVAQPTARVVETVRDKSVDKPVEKTPVKVEKLPEKSPEKSTEKALAKPAEKTAAKNDDAKRAAAILGGQSSEAKPVSASGEYLVLIGAFSNEANVKNLKAKLAEQGIRTFSEPLDTPQGKKTRVRAGPFASREAAEKALEKMQRIGVSGAIAAKQ
jgi:DedD protein